ncbi:hypothetical protein [Ensifer sp. ENS03]|uniref:hypothetical protein n=1 Tax=Ensifer sp. ENS03 TaxID=2769283 RepID=UPI001781AE12|nr:hypothetical protein [Ensifer sp. ENS03]MBD9559591.1 hypothetical protein [Ensifer sp. ENS03]
MLFNLERDFGDVVEGYVIPDGFSERPHIVVADHQGAIVTLPCDQLRPAVVASGRHETGEVGFRLDESNVPNLGQRTTLSVHDQKSGLLVYRRPRPFFQVDMKVIRLETQLLPMIKLDQYLGGSFQYALQSVERFGHETTLQAFHLNAVDSIYLSGRLLLRNYQQFFDKGFKGIVLLTDPYYELATRIAILKRMARSTPKFLGDRDRLMLNPAAQFFEDLDLDDPAAINRSLRKAPEKVRNVLISPTTRQLACSTPEQLPTRREIAAAIDLLSRFEIVGHNNDTLPFANAISELLGVETNGMLIAEPHVLVERLAGTLRTMPIAELLLEDDLIFDYYVRQATQLRHSQLS